jgi:hypothetical protein
MDDCTCCCLDCIEGSHCGGLVNDHGICREPSSDYDLYDDLELIDEYDDALLDGEENETWQV